MRAGPRLRRSFFERPCAVVARDLVGCLLERSTENGSRLVARLVEVEAYLGEGLDPGSHAHNGWTPRNRSMFGPPGRIYAYRSYGIHTCVNLVCEPAGAGAAVLLRAAEPLEGIAEMCENRKLAAPTQGPTARGLRVVASGPGRLAQAFGFGLEDDGASVLRSPIALRAPGEGWDGCGAVSSGPRVGISRGTDLAYRFCASGHPCVSAWRPGRAKRGA